MRRRCRRRPRRPGRRRGSREGRLVARAAADDDPRRRSAVGPAYTQAAARGRRLDEPRVGDEDPADHLVDAGEGVVQELAHGGAHPNPSGARPREGERRSGRAATRRGGRPRARAVETGRTPIVRIPAARAAASPVAVSSSATASAGSAPRPAARLEIDVGRRLGPAATSSALTTAPNQSETPPRRSRPGRPGAAGFDATPERHPPAEHREELERAGMGAHRHASPWPRPAESSPVSSAPRRPARSPSGSARVGHRTPMSACLWSCRRPGRAG